MKLPFLITNPKSGEKSVSLTMLVSAYSVLILWLVFGGIFNISFIREFDAMVFIEVFTPIATLYFSNKLTPTARAHAAKIVSDGIVSPVKAVEAPHPIDDPDEDELDTDENPGG